LRTHRLSSDAEAVRDALLNTREPESLLFEALPQACGIDPFLGSLRGRGDDIDVLRRRLSTALDELRSSYADLLDECRETLSVEFRLNEKLSDLRLELRGQVAPLTDTLLEPRLRSFVLLAAQGELDDTSWLEAVANNVAKRPAATWRDDDVTRFEVEMRGMAGAYRRVLSLHYDDMAAQRAGFDAHRVTMTNPDGTEHSTVVWIDHDTKPHVEQIAHEARAKVEKLLGARGGEALLALLAESVLDQGKDADHRTTADTAGHKGANYA
jgi:hypothetical protein